MAAAGLGSRVVRPAFFCRPLGSRDGAAGWRKRCAGPRGRTIGHGCVAADSRAAARNHCSDAVRYGLARNVEVWNSTHLPGGWDQLPAVQAGQVYAVDANGYFSRSGPRLADGVALLARLFHPEQFAQEIASGLGADSAWPVQRIGAAPSFIRPTA